MMQPIMLKRQAPFVRLLDVRESTTNATTYTFTSVSAPPQRGCPSVASETYGASPHLRSATRSLLAVIVHAEDAAVTFGVSSVTFGGVGGTERVDRGGGTSAINTAIYTWTGDLLGAVTTTDVVVTFSEAVTGCAIGVVEISNIGAAEIGSSTSGSGTGILTFSPSPSITQYGETSIGLYASTMITGASSETFSTGIINGATPNGGSPIVLYEGQNAEFAYAAAFSLSNQYTADGNAFAIASEWSGATAGDLAGLIVI